MPGRTFGFADGSRQRFSGAGKRTVGLDEGILKLEGLKTSAKDQQHSGTGLSIENGHGLPIGKFHAHCETAAAQLTVGSVNKKTGPNSQGVTERPGEFSNGTSVGIRRHPKCPCTESKSENL